MENMELQPATYIGIHERTVGTKLLYLSSSIRQALLYEPSELIGVSAEVLIDDGESTDEFKTHHGSATDDNVIMTSLFCKTKTGLLVYIRAISFACGNVNVGIVSTYPHINSPAQLAAGPVSIQRYKCVLNDQQENAGLRSRGTGVDPSAMYSMRTSHQACFVLGDFNADDDADGEAGPKI
ncbi:hypothetical protein GGI12_004924, partial [Dipsacomyces acuminosporus]